MLILWRISFSKGVIRVIFAIEAIETIEAIGTIGTIEIIGGYINYRGL